MKKNILFITISAISMIFSVQSAVLTFTHYLSDDLPLQMVTNMRRNVLSPAVDLKKTSVPAQNLFVHDTQGYAIGEFWIEIEHKGTLVRLDSTLSGYTFDVDFMLTMVNSYGALYFQLLGKEPATGAISQASLWKLTHDTSELTCLFQNPARVFLK